MAYWIATTVCCNVLFYMHNYLLGMYLCSQCGNKLFVSDKKFNHSSPWPAFSQTADPDSVKRLHVEVDSQGVDPDSVKEIHGEDKSQTVDPDDVKDVHSKVDQPLRIKISCGKCGLKLGHEFLAKGESRF